MHIRTQEKGAVTPQETDPDLPVSVQESPAEAWVAGGLGQGLGALNVAVHAWDFWKEVATVFITSTIVSSVQLSSVAQSCPTLCDPMNHSTPGLPVHHQLPEFTQTHIH